MNLWQDKAERVLSGINLKFNIPMSELTTFKIGGPLDLLVEPEDLDELQRVIQFSREEKIPWIIIGFGSNLLVRDKGIRGIGIKLSGVFTSWEVNGIQVTAGAGMPLADLAKKTACSGLAGLEFACGIPGTVGGAVYMNAGAYEGEIAQVLERVQAFDPQNGEVWYEKNDLNLSYRSSIFQKNSQIILKLVLELRPAIREHVELRITELTCQRETKQPLEMPSAGSVFRRPPNHFVGPLIQDAGLKGFMIGGAQVSPKHAGFIVNTGKATAHDVIALIAYIRKVIKEKNNVELIPEIKIIGEE